ncbi:DUF6366 family protein [Bacillus sp. FJAT-50079]|uniref:DUF6366 family protein n=1 Tax=Bacillus sp. FJAT-50079 TaxID=2833577 RepID=UPI001BC8E331|nr:DUF6366 family protein [Bacillus sp. FJAT-50079]MBS4209991.1 hypothetical protein [Bacillus sp. FJAT-50079]
MRHENETPERRRDRLRLEELKRNPTGSLNDAFTRANSGSLADLVGSLGWKGTGILLAVTIIGFILISFIFS